ncbi:tetratricopeptide repeat protein [Aliarcobacter butzleri]|jgi:tetratricopeptide (TPR) repeat protein|uniref:tetratricopeptide repeat protein n=1 Tax=Aliarcobacter butzleri TaxID=28197 RepID=UPI0021B2B7DC|nr:tetratricopeptide repeat protein [Aliarcobacter butzleri]MCT7634745.1 tetratricopeptide repeat protein [Aliarcobacter butzleri]
MEIIECPQCGAAPAPSDRKCNYCKAEFFVTSLAYLGSLDINGVSKYLKHYKEIITKEPDNTEGLMGLGLCYLQMGNYQLSKKCFEQLIESSPFLSQPYYYFVLSSVKGRRLRTISMSEAKQFDTYVNSAIQIDDLPHYWLFLAMLKGDYFISNGLKTAEPSIKDILNKVSQSEISRNEIAFLQKAVKTGKEDEYYSYTRVID